MSEIINAKIISTHLGEEDHGIFTAAITCQNGSRGAGLPAYDLRGDWAWRFINGIIVTVGASRWEDLPGKIIRLRIDGGEVTAIGHVLEDRWFCPRTFIEEAMA